MVHFFSSAGYLSNILTYQLFLVRLLFTMFSFYGMISFMRESYWQSSPEAWDQRAELSAPDRIYFRRFDHSDHTELHEQLAEIGVDRSFKITDSGVSAIDAPGHLVPEVQRILDQQGLDAFLISPGDGSCAHLPPEV
jgi:hypothetical protein